MKSLIIITLSVLSLTSCNRWRIPDAENKYLMVLKRDKNLTKTKARLYSFIKVDAVSKDTLVSHVNSGKATITRTIKEGVTIPSKTKGYIVEENGYFYFVFKKKEYRQKVGRLPLNVESSKIYIRTINKVIVGTNLKLDINDPGFELRIKERERTESIKAN